MNIPWPNNNPNHFLINSLHLVDINSNVSHIYDSCDLITTLTSTDIDLSVPLADRKFTAHCPNINPSTVMLYLDTNEGVAASANNPYEFIFYYQETPSGQTIWNNQILKVGNIYLFPIDNSDFSKPFIQVTDAQGVSHMLKGGAQQSESAIQVLTDFAKPSGIINANGPLFKIIDTRYNSDPYSDPYYVETIGTSGITGKTGTIDTSVRDLFTEIENIKGNVSSESLEMIFMDARSPIIFILWMVDLRSYLI